MATMGRSTRPSLAAGGGIAIIVALSAATAVACRVPVFRYALERWAPAPYDVVVLTREGIPRTDPRLASLVAAEGRGAVTLEVADASRPLAAPLAAAWTVHGGDGPVAVVHYPRSATAGRDGGGAEGDRRRVAHVTRLDAISAAAITASPARNAIGRHLVSGATAVWVLLETSDAAANATARRTLEDALARARDTIRLPDAAELAIDPTLLDDVRIPLGIDFPLVALPRDDAEEAFLVDCLLGSEEDLRDYDDPIAFPVFGRGVVLHALVGRGITPENIEDAHTFITGACSCVVKEQNPGFDLLLDVDWAAAVGDVLVSDPPSSVGTKPKLLTIPSGARPR
jgi:hypothetical protein